MSGCLRSLLVAALWLSLHTVTLAQEAKPEAGNAALAAADQLCRAGKFAEAETSYRALVKADPNLIGAQTGLVRSLLRQQKVDDAMEAVTAALAVQSSSPALLAARGDVQFRLGDMAGAESSYTDAKMLDRKEVRTRLGLMRLYQTQSMYLKAYEELVRAHDLAPNDVEVQQAWFLMLPRREKLAAMQAYLAGVHSENDEATKWVTEEVEFLKQTVDKPAHDCRLTSKVEQTEAKLDLLKNPVGVRSGISLSVRLGNRVAGLQLDTGTGGILLSRRTAERAGLTRISDAHFAGLVDKGPRSGYWARVDHIQIGELQFQDCVVGVIDKFPDANQEGSIGADTFSHYLLEIDVPGTRLVLSPLPKRPRETQMLTSLNSRGEEPALSEPGEAAEGGAAAVSSGDQKDPAEGSGQRRAPPERYIASDMARWTQIFRFGHTFLVPTTVNDSESMLFGLETGAFDNVLAERAGRQTSKVKPSFGPRVSGFTGEVKKVFHAKVTLRVGHLQQSNLDITTLDLSDMSAKTGTEVSGLLGFVMLQMLDIKLDQRDGLAQMTFDPKRVQQLLKP